MEKEFVYMVNDNDHSIIFVLHTQQEKNKKLESGKSYRYMTSEEELFGYMKNFPDSWFMYQDDVEKIEAHRLSDIFGVPKL